MGSVTITIDGAALLWIPLGVCALGNRGVTAAQFSRLVALTVRRSMK